MDNPTPNTVVRTVDWKALVEEIEDLRAPHDAYEFTGRTFEVTEKNGIYRDSE